MLKGNLYFDFHLSAAQRPAQKLSPVDFIVTNLPMQLDWVVRFFNQRGKAEQHI